MSAARLTAAAAAFAVCAVFGAVRSARQNVLLESMDDLITDVRYAASIIELEHLPIGDMAKRLAFSGKCRTLWKETAESMSRGSTFEKAFESASKPPMCPEAARVTEKLASFLGSGDVKTEVTRLLSAAERLSEIRAIKETELAQKAKLVRVLSVMLGTAFALLII